MNLQKLNPWNWFKHEDAARREDSRIPVRHPDYPTEGGHSSMPQLYQEIDRLWDAVTRDFGFSPWMADRRGRGSLADFSGHAKFSPELNVSSDEKEYAVTLEAAGMEQQDISLETGDGKLFIRGNKSEETEQKDKHFYRIERRYGNFQRVLDLPEDAVVDDISASMKNGLLTIKIPRRKLEASNSKKIEILSA